MTEPTSTGTLVTLATTVGLASLMPGVDADAVVGAFAGATLFVVSAKDLPLWKRLFYLAISVVAGYFAGPEAMRVFHLESSGLASFFCAACVITLTLRLIERSATAELPSIRRGGPNA